MARAIAIQVSAAIFSVAVSLNREAKMTPEYWQRIKAVMNAVMDAPQEQQEALLDTLCDGEPAFRQDVSAFLNADEPDLPKQPLIQKFNF